MISAMRRDSFDITYRIDSNPAQSTRWNELTNNKGAGLFGSGSEGFLRGLYDAESFFIRLTDSNGQRHDAEFDLAGIQDAIEAVAGACGWSTLDLSPDDYRAIQTLLNAGGFDAGTRECPELCVSVPVHAVSDTQASKRSPNIMANWLR
ncbi:hypothetical protein N5A93_18200, partial [Roseovarius sp. EGI FJ00037]|nr:hypothetical protein [Roseovarius sp. EGI FJ00037]